jgi:secondary thiamine-phosphate synthase enzyme
MVATSKHHLQTRGQGDAHDITAAVAAAVGESRHRGRHRHGLRRRLHGAVTTIEFEPGAVADFNRLFDELAPRDAEYDHHARWGDDNGSSHVRAALLGPSLTVPIVDGQLTLGTWQQIMLLEFDTRPRRREIVIQILGDSYANRHRPWQLFQRVFYDLLAQCRQQTGRKKFRFKNPLLSLDATMIDVCAELFPWATYKRTKGAVKLHFTLDHDGYLPTALVITEGTQHEVTVARQQHFLPGTILIVDRGFIDYGWFADLTRAGVFFVTRLKDDASVTVVRRRPRPETGGIVADEEIRLRVYQTRAKYGPELPLRRVEVVSPDGVRLVFLTNNLTLGATTISRIYKDRWQIELLFKALKQNLRVKTFVGTSANAVHIQIWTALIALLLVKYLQLRATFGWSLSTLLALLRMNLLVYRDLWRWLDDPFPEPPRLPSVQAALAFD